MFVQKENIQMLIFVALLLIYIYIYVITDIILYIEIFDINLYISLIIYFHSHIIVFNALQII